MCHAIVFLHSTLEYLMTILIKLIDVLTERGLAVDKRLSLKLRLNGW